MIGEYWNVDPCCQGGVPPQQQTATITGDKVFYSPCFTCPPSVTGHHYNCLGHEYDPKVGFFLPFPACPTCGKCPTCGR